MENQPTNQPHIASLDDFLWNDIPKNMLKVMLKKHTLSHSILIEGATGTGKKTFAKIIAQGILCLGSVAPCFDCPSCYKVSNSIHPDVKMLSPDTKGGKYSADLARKMIKDAYTVPLEGKACVFIVPNLAHMSENIQNILLKIIEEPPKHCYFIFTCQNRKEVLPTVLSRTALLRLDTPSANQLRAVMPLFMGEYTSEDYNKAINISTGGLGEVLSLMEHKENFVLYEIAQQCAKEIVMGSSYTLLTLFFKFNKKREDAVALLDFLEHIFMDVLVIKKIQSQQSSFENELSLHCSSGFIVFLLQGIKRAKLQIQNYCDVSLVLTSLCANIKSAI